MACSTSESAGLMTHVIWSWRRRRGSRPPHATHPRGCGATARSGAYDAGLDHVRTANERVLVFAMIETAEGLREVRDRRDRRDRRPLRRSGEDLSLSLGLSTFADLADERLAEALDAVVAAARAAGVVAGVHAPSPDRTLEMLERGFTFVTPLVDDDAVADRAADALAALGRR